MIKCNALFYFITICFILISEAISGQSLKLEAGIGYGNYSMDGLKTFNDEILKRLPVEAKITDNFPAHQYYYASLLYQVESPVYLGLTCGYYTTGSRISYKDYSGELKYDNILTAYTPGITIGANLINKKLVLKGETNLSYSLSKLKVKESVLTENETTELLANSVQLEPRMALIYPWKNLEFGLKAGYRFDFGAEYRLEDDKETILENKNGDSIKSNWSGYRISISVSYNINLGLNK